MANPRFGLLPLPLSKSDLGVDRELLVDPNTGHIYVRNGSNNLSKTVENENRLNVIDKFSKYTNVHLSFGATDWSYLVKKLNGKGGSVSIKYDLAQKCVVCTVAAASSYTFDTTMMYIDVPVSIGSPSSLFTGMTVELNTDVGQTFQIGALCYDNNGTLLTSTVNTFAASKTVSGVGKEIKVQGILKGTKATASGKSNSFETNTGVVRVCFGFKGGNTSGFSFKIKNIDVFEVPEYLSKISGGNMLEVDADLNYDDVKVGDGVNIVNDGTASVGKSFEITTNKNVQAISMFSNDLKPGVYSFGARVKVDKQLSGQIYFNMKFGKKTDATNFTYVTKNVTNTHITKYGKYVMIYGAFEYDEIAFENRVVFELSVNGKSDNAVKFNIDYLMVNPSSVGTYGIK